MKSFISLLFTFFIFVNSYSQCNTNTSICNPGVAGPFDFISASANPSSCMDFYNGAASANYAYITLYITEGGNLNLLIDGDQTTGFLDVSIFDITNASDPCAALSLGTEIGCNYASSSAGCNEFGSTFPCSAEVAAPIVSAGDVIMILVEDWSNVMTSFTLELSNVAGSAQTGPPDPTIDPISPFCPSDNPLQLMAANPGGVWSGVGVTPSGVFNPALSGPGTFMIDYSIGSAPCNASAQAEIIVHQPLDLSLTSDDDEICSGEQTVLHATVLGSPADIEYSWSPAESLSYFLDSDPTATPFSTTLYEVMATNTITGCSLSEQITISVAGDFTIDAGADQTVCDAAGLNLNAVPSVLGTYDWTWQSGAEVTIIDSPATQVVNNETNEFIVSASDGECLQTDTVNIFVLYPTLDLGPDLTICEGEELILDTGFSDEIHLWNTTEETAIITISEEQMYVVEITSSLGCSIMDSVFLDVIPLPILDLGSDQSLCSGAVYDINAGNPGATYLWNTMEFTQAISVDTTGIFSVEVLSADNCLNTDEISVVFHENPTMILPEEINICEDEVITIDAENAGSNFSWSPNLEVTQSIDVNVSEVYSVIITNPEGCVSVDQTEVIAVAYPMVDLGPDQSACDGEFIQLNAQVSGGLNVNWSVPENTSSLEVSTSGVYTVTVDNDDCFSSDSVSIFFNPLPQNMLEEEITTCFDTDLNSLVLNASNFGSNFLWSTGAQTASVEVDEPGLYSVNITTPFGCESTFYTEVYELCIEPYIYVPNSFTPDGDGINDVWKADGIFIMDFEIQVFNRWGEVVFESADVNEVWQGNDQKGNYYCPPGVYTYQLRFKYRVNESRGASDWDERKGQVVLLR